MEVATIVGSTETNLVLNYTTHLTDNGTDPNNSTNLTQPDKYVTKYYPIIAGEMVLSCLLLIFSLAVYCVLPEFRNVHGKNLISMSSCLLITYFMLTLDLAIRNYISFAACFAIAMVIHVTFLATFFWTNVMTFDIWHSLTNMKAKGNLKSRSWRYFKYSIYAWLATVLTALPAALFELTNWVPEEYRPQFGVKRCWLSGTTAFTYYFNLPVGFILLCNLIMFALTLRKLLIIKKSTAILNLKKQQKRLYLYLKLFIVMGITWITEFLPWVTGVHSLYALAGMLTALHGCVLFLIFVCKKRILRLFWDRIHLRKKPSASQYTISQQTTSSSASTNKKASLDNLADSEF